MQNILVKNKSEHYLRRGKMEYLFIYSLQMAIYIKLVAICLLVITLFVCVGTVLFFFGDEELKQNWNNWMKKTLITSLVTSLILLALPTKQTLLLMGGTYLGKRAANKVINSDNLEKINTIIDLQLDRYIKDLKAGNNGR